MMSMFVDKLKLNAAANSMYQFCPELRKVLPKPSDDRVVEAATVFLYERLAQDVFGRRFAGHLSSRLRDQSRFATPYELDARVVRIGRNLEDFERLSDKWTSDQTNETQFANYVTSAIRALLVEAGSKFEDDTLVRDTFPRFEEAVRRIKQHLQGIKSQSTFVMRR